jgi:hypothetical protein
MASTFVKASFVPINTNIGWRRSISKMKRPLFFGQPRQGENRTRGGFQELVAEFSDAYTEIVGGEGKENGVVMLRVRTASLFSSQCSEIISKVNVTVYFKAEMRGNGSRVIRTCSTS